MIGDIDALVGLAVAQHPEGIAEGMDGGNRPEHSAALVAAHLAGLFVELGDLPVHLLLHLLVFFQALLQLLLILLQLLNNGPHLAVDGFHLPDFSIRLPPQPLGCLFLGRHGGAHQRQLLSFILQGQNIPLQRGHIRLVLFGNALHALAFQQIIGVILGVEQQLQVGEAAGLGYPLELDTQFLPDFIDILLQYLRRLGLSAISRSFSPISVSSRSTSPPKRSACRAMLSICALRSSRCCCWFARSFFDSADFAFSSFSCFSSAESASRS